MTPQQEILCHYLRGDSLTVVTARELYHTTELRRVNSRLNDELIPTGKMIIGEFENGNNYKTYRLQKTVQMKMVI